MKGPRRILVLTLAFGSGHVQAARAVAQEIERQSPGASVRVVDALKESRLLFRAFYAWPYWAMVRHAPALWARFFASRVARGDDSTAPRWAFRRGCARIFKLIEDFQPEAIVACEVAACELAALAKREGRTRARIVAVITDHEAEPVWVKPEVDAYAVADEGVLKQLCVWGARAECVTVCGIPTDATFNLRHDAEETRRRHAIKGDAPLTLLMGGGMGPTRMDAVAALLCQSGLPLHVVAVAGQDARAHRKLARLKAKSPASLHILGWTEEVAALMQAASVLVTKPGGLTTAEAALSSLPVVFFDAIPGPERRNAARVAEAGAGIIAGSPEEASRAALSLLRDEDARWSMSERARQFARPDATATVARLALDARAPVQRAVLSMTTRKRQAEQMSEHDNPVLILTIANGAGHISVAEGLAAAVRATRPDVPVIVVDVADYMGALTRFTHVTAYLWLVKHAPALWDRIDRYQKRQEHTSPEWYYRRGLRSLFALARKLRPHALIATEVGCCEIAALIKRDLCTEAPLVAVNDDPDADRAWVQPEVDLYCFVSEQLCEELVAHGAEARRVVAWGVPLRDGFGALRGREEERAEVCGWLDLDPRRPLVLVAGGGEGMGLIEETTARLLALQEHAPQIVTLTGNNARLKARCERLAKDGAGRRLRVLGWTDRVPQLMAAADLMVSKLGSMFNEALAAQLPIIALEPPPGAERVQYRLLEEWKTGRAVRTPDEAVGEVERLLAQPLELRAMRERARERRKPDAALRIARWLDAELRCTPLRRSL